MICLDTHILIWGIRGWATPGQEDMIPRARRFIEHLEASQSKVMIPTPVLAEYLTRIPPEDHHAHCTIFEQNFFLPPLDVSSAQIAARLLYNPDHVRTIRNENNVDRQSLRTDALIIAIAIAHKADRIITHDSKHFKKLAQGEVLVNALPQLPPQQGSLFPS